MGKRSNKVLLLLLLLLLPLLPPLPLLPLLPSRARRTNAHRPTCDAFQWERW